MSQIIVSLLGIHDEVDDGVDGRVGHGQPEEEEEDVLGGGVGAHSLEYEITFNEWHREERCVCTAQFCTVYVDEQPSMP